MKNARHSTVKHKASRYSMCLFMSKEWIESFWVDIALNG